MRRLLSLLLLAAALTPAHASIAQTSVTVTTPTHEVRAFSWGHKEVRVVTFVAGGGAVLKKVMPYPVFAGRKTTSGMGIASGAIAAVNGDFRMLGTQAPKHQSVIDGEIMSTGNPRLPGWVLRTNADGTQAWISRPVFDVTVTQGEVSFPIVGWNAQQPTGHRVVAFTARGGSDRYPTAPTCSALLAPVSGVTTPDRVYKVVAIRKHAECDRAPLQPPRGQFPYVVLAGLPVRGLRLGATLDMHVDLGKNGVVTQVIGGVPAVVKQGRNVGPTCDGVCLKWGEGPDGPFRAKNPRTALGISEGCSDWDLGTPCTYFLVTVDGRQRDWSEGVRFPALGTLMLELGAFNAMNLDGGGSTTMWVRQRSDACQSRTKPGCVVNRPTYGERAILDSVALLPV